MNEQKVDLSPNDIIIAEILFALLKETNGEVLVTYKWLAKQANKKGLGHQPDALHTPLDKINRKCKEINSQCPMISTLVINHELAVPGPGFFDLLNNLSQSEEVLDNNKAFLKEWEHLRQYKGWDDIIAEFEKL
ncbi:MAG: hypothetical protein IJ170_10445 [Ruminococcus sp.]|nr:hypothetical protein [Ruminococcus sp.]